MIPVDELRPLSAAVCWRCGGIAGRRRRTPWSGRFCATPGYWRRAAIGKALQLSLTRRRS